MSSPPPADPGQHLCGAAAAHPRGNPDTAKGTPVRQRLHNLFGPPRNRHGARRRGDAHRPHLVAVDGINFYSPPPADNCHGDIPGQRKEQHGRLLRSVSPRERRLGRSEEHTSELQSLMRISYAVFCLYIFSFFFLSFFFFFFFFLFSFFFFFF